jgi:hypothetical protein
MPPLFPFLHVEQMPAGPTRRGAAPSVPSVPAG